MKIDLDQYKPDENGMVTVPIDVYFELQNGANEWYSLPKKYREFVDAGKNKGMTWEEQETILAKFRREEEENS